MVFFTFHLNSGRLCFMRRDLDLHRHHFIEIHGSTNVRALSDHVLCIFHFLYESMV